MVLDKQRLALLCNMEQEDVLRLPGFTLWATKEGRRYAFRDNGGSVLAVAHTDVVKSWGRTVYKWAKDKDGHFKVAGVKQEGEEKTQAKANRRSVEGMALDDRLGVYLITEVLPALGIVVDVLLTDEEESGSSTADIFVVPEGKQYNWVFSFDRAGTDVVMYQYEDPDGGWEEFFKPFGIDLGSGSFSCITELEKLGVKAFNFGCGYHAQHTAACYANLKEVRGCVERFAKFHAKYKDTPMPHDEVGKWGSYSYRGWGGAYGSSGKYGKLLDGIDPWGDEYCDEYCTMCNIPIKTKDLELWGDLPICVDCYGALLWGDVAPPDEMVEATDEELDEVEGLLWEGVELHNLTGRQKEVALAHVYPRYY